MNIAVDMATINCLLPANN